MRPILKQKPFVTALVIPTGIGASVGGYGGDAMPALELLSSVSDCLITHPNVANAAMFQSLPDNALYVEGYGLDQFFKGEWALRPVRQNRIGLIMDAGIEPAMRTVHLNTINAVQAVYGIEVVGWVETAEPVEVACGHAPSGSSWGRLENPQTVLDAARKLVSLGATAIALAVQMPDLEGEEEYGQGEGVDPVGGIEAILSHWLVASLGIPAAHAPVFAQEKSLPEYEQVVDPRAASEYITPTFLPCVLTGLARAPRFIGLGSASAHEASVALQQEDLKLDDLGVLVLPHDALGGIPALACMASGIPIIAVKENHTVMDVEQSFWTQLSGSAAKIYTAQSYLEAAGMIQAMRLGLRLPLLKPEPVTQH